MSEREFKTVVRAQLRSLRVRTDKAVREWLRNEHGAVYVRPYVRKAPKKASIPDIERRILAALVVPTIPSQAQHQRA